MTIILFVTHLSELLLFVLLQERLDFAMKEIVFDLLSVGRPIKIILTPEVNSTLFTYHCFCTVELPCFGLYLGFFLHL